MHPGLIRLAVACLATSASAAGIVAAPTHHPQGDACLAEFAAASTPAAK